MDERNKEEKKDEILKERKEYRNKDRLKKVNLM